METRRKQQQQKKQQEINKTCPGLIDRKWSVRNLLRKNSWAQAVLVSATGLWQKRRQESGVTVLSLAHPHLSLTIQPQFKPSAGLPWSSMVKNRPAKAGDTGPIPGPGTSHVLQRNWSPWDATPDTHVPHSKRGAPPTPARGSPHTAKTQHTQQKISKS